MPAQGPGDESEREVAGRGVGEDLGGMVTALAATTDNLGHSRDSQCWGRSQAGLGQWAGPVQLKQGLVPGCSAPALKASGLADSRPGPGQDMLGQPGRLAPESNSDLDTSQKG